jgi:putative ABC transport system permease protein
MMPPNRKMKKPPRVGEWLFSRMTAYADHYASLGDLEEDYRKMLEAHGRFKARFWYWTQVCIAIPKYITHGLYWRITMLQNYLKVALRNIQKHKSYSIINILGLALGMACCILIFLWVQDELSFDTFHQNKNDIYRVVGDWERNNWKGFEGTPSPLAPAIIEEIPEIVKAVRVAEHSRKVFKYGDKVFYEERGIIADPALFEIFTFPFLKGHPTFTQPQDMVISESMAQKYFGSEVPIGKHVEIDGRLATITGVFEDCPQNSHLQFDFVSSFEFIDDLSGYGTGWGSFNFVTYVLLQKERDIKSLGEKITALALRKECPQVSRGVHFRLQELSRVHLDARDYQRTAHVWGSSSQVYLFSLIAVLVLLIACVNFMNLSTARSSIRAREVGMRKTVGACRHQIIKQFFGESILLSVIAGLFALVMVILLLPKFNDLSGKRLSVEFSNVGIILGYVVIVLMTGVVAGSYPAFFLSSFRPIVVLKEAVQSGRRGAAFRRVLVVFQFTLSILLIIGTTIIYRQLHFIRHKELGFDKDNIVFIPIKENLGDKYETVKAELLRNPDILSVSASWNYLTSTWRNSGWRWEGRDPDRQEHVDIILCGVDFDFFETLDLQMVEGRSFSGRYADDGNMLSVIFNQSAIREMGLENPVGKWFILDDDKPANIIGVVKDVHFQSLRRKIHPRVFFIYDMSKATQEGIILIKIKGNRITPALAAIKGVWEDFNPISPFEYRFLDEAYDELYRKEQRVGTVLNYFTSLAIIISCLGLFGLASFMAERRTKEIGIRKVLGAPVMGIVVLLSKEFTRWIIVSNLIAWPVGYFAGKKLLQTFAYKIHLGPDIFILSGLAALFMAVVTVSFHAFRVARANPVNALKYE